MYNSSNRHGSGQRSSFSGPSNGPRKSFGGPSYRSSTGGRPQFNTSRGRNRFSTTKIDVSRYVNTNVPVSTVPVAKYEPKHNFVDFQIDERLKANIVAKGYKIPTPIQDKSIPEILAGKDIVGIANTGTGKTAAFLIPLINKIMLGKKEQILIIAPTRELAIQINDEFKEFTTGFGMHSVCAVGGAHIGRQISELRYFNSVVVGTPGRIKDLMERGVLNLLPFKTVVLDEADRMLDMGFINDMHLIMAKMSKERHTLFFSATLSSDIEKLIKDFLKDPVRISVKTGDTSKNIEQDVVRVPRGADKMDILHEMLSREGFEKVLIFGRTKHGVQKLSDSLSKKGFTSTAIHGNKNQSQRQRALTDFKTNMAKILVATDVAARGLDIPNVSHVINFDLPATHEDYIHRIGRTGRGDKKGKALTFVD